VTTINAIDAKVVDTTGAGDLYASGFLYGMINNLPMEACGRIGSILAGRTIEVIGPKMSAEQWNTVKKMVAAG
jgi:sugar/nucleoside kinase (ribokinase family)